MNYGLNKVIGDDETGFRGVSDDVYRMEGLGLRHRRRRAVQQSRLLVRGRLRGRDVPVSGVAAWRRQPGAAPAAEDPRATSSTVSISSAMAPDNAVITEGAPPGGTARALVEPGRAMAIYLRKKRAAADRRKRSRRRLTLDRPDRCESTCPRASGAPSGSTR